jgi:hypothetical protein
MRCFHLYTQNKKNKTKARERRGAKWKGRELGMERREGRVWMAHSQKSTIGGGNGKGRSHALNQGKFPL